MFFPPQTVLKPGPPVLRSPTKGCTLDHFFEIANRRDLDELGVGSGGMLVEEPPPHIDHEFRFFRVACPELQEALVVVAHIRDAREGDPVMLSLQDFLNAEFHLLIESVVDRLELQGLVEVPLDVHGFCDGFLSGSLQENQLPRHDDGRFDLSLYDEGLLRGFRIVRVDPGGFPNLAVVSSGIDSQGDFSLPSGEDGPVEVGNRAASPWIHFVDFKGLVAFVQNPEGVFNDSAFVHVSEIKSALRKEHGRSGRGLSEGSSEKNNAKQNS